MNNTTKAKYEMARKMLIGHIDAHEVALITELPIEEVQKICDEVTPADSKTLELLDNMDIDFGPILRDTYETSDEFDSEDSEFNI